MRLSPLAPGKWEYESVTHFYFLQSREYENLAHAQKHVFVIGHRGTGKTTLLHALDWGERVSNPDLRAQFPEGPFTDGNIGCYVGLKLLDLQLFEAWLSDSSPAVSHLILGAYFRAIWMEETVRALRAVLRFFGSDDLAAEVAALGSLRDEIATWLPPELGVVSGSDHDELTLDRLLLIGSRLRDLLHNEATLSLRPAEQLVARLNLGRFQRLSTTSFRAFAAILYRAQPDTPWRFRMCMDEGEYLSQLAKSTVRTLVRECESPLFLVVSALSDLGTETVTPGVTITLDDRRILELDSRSADELKALIDGIVGERLRAAGYPCETFSIGRLLGDPDLNELLLAHPSENGQLRALKAAWPKTSYPGTAGQRQARRDSPIRSFLESEGLISPVAGLPAEVARQVDSSGYRKYQLAGYLLLLGRCNIRRPFYAGYRIFLHMSDNSIRDLLLSLDLLRQEWWRRAGKKRKNELMTVDDYCQFVCAKGVSRSVQDIALRKLGSEKLSAFSERVIHFTQAASRLLNFVGRASHMLDFGEVSGPSGPRLDAATFVIQLREVPILRDRASMGRRERTGNDSIFVDIVHACAEEGFLKILSVSEETREIRFRLHHTLSRHYGCSYRASQYTTSLDWAVVSTVVEGPLHRSLDRLVERAVDHRPLSGQPELFPSWDDSEGP